MSSTTIRTTTDDDDDEQPAPPPAVHHQTAARANNKANNSNDDGEDGKNNNRQPPPSSSPPPTSSFFEHDDDNNEHNNNESISRSRSSSSSSVINVDAEEEEDHDVDVSEEEDNARAASERRKAMIRNYYYYGRPAPPPPATAAVIVPPSSSAAPSSSSSAASTAAAAAAAAAAGGGLVASSNNNNNNSKNHRQTLLLSSSSSSSPSSSSSEEEEDIVAQLLLSHSAAQQQPKRIRPAAAAAGNEKQKEEESRRRRRRQRTKTTYTSSSSSSPPPPSAKTNTATTTTIPKSSNSPITDATTTTTRSIRERKLFVQPPPPPTGNSTHQTTQPRQQQPKLQEEMETPPQPTTTSQNRRQTRQIIRTGMAVEDETISAEKNRRIPPLCSSSSDGRKGPEFVDDDDTARSAAAAVPAAVPAPIPVPPAGSTPAGSGSSSSSSMNRRPRADATASSKVAAAAAATSKKKKEGAAISSFPPAAAATTEYEEEEENALLPPTPPNNEQHQRLPRGDDDGDGGVEPDDDDVVAAPAAASSDLRNNKNEEITVTKTTTNPVVVGAYTCSESQSQNPQQYSSSSRDGGDGSDEITMLSQQSQQQNHHPKRASNLLEPQNQEEEDEEEDTGDHATEQLQHDDNDVLLPVGPVGGRYDDLPSEVLYSNRAGSSGDDDDGNWHVEEAAASWKNEEEEDDTSFDQSLNRFGVFHVRVLRAYNLPCPIGSHVQAIVRLHPWKGKVRILEKATSFGGRKNGVVCIQFDPHNHDMTSMVHALYAREHHHDDDDVDGDRDDDGDVDGDDGEGAYTSPLPEIQIDLVFTPLGMFEFTMCQLKIDGRFLLEHPNDIQQQWFQATPNSSNSVLVHVEAMFEPGTDTASSVQDDQLVQDTSITRDGGSSVGGASSLVDVAGSLPSLSVNQRHRRHGQHLLRVTTFHATPASCCVCDKSLLWKKALQCEECKVDCCDDCRLTVDVELPCGSDEAVEAVAAAIQNRWSVDRFMNMIAPVDTTSLPAKTISENKVTPTPALDDQERGIGSFKLKLRKAYILAEHLPAETDPSSVLSRKDLRFRHGDYYVRVSWTGSTRSMRTRTIQNSKGRPVLEAGEMRILVPHYGADFRIELVDATTDKTIGTSILTTQGLLQQQRDYLVEEKRVPFLTFLRPIRFREVRTILLELRTGSIRTGADFFASAKEHDGDVKQGDIVGCIEAQAGFEEDLENLFGPDPYSCPARPGDDLNMKMFQLHLMRISAIIEDIKECVELYRFVVGWKNPFVTGLSLIFFLRVSMWFDPAYIGSLPVLLLMLGMIYLAGKRYYGKKKQKFIRKEIEKNRKAENGTVDYDIHRPAGLVRVSVERGRNIRSPELGLPGNVGCRVYWDPIRYATEKEKKKAVAVDESASSVHEIGSTNHVYAANPTWNTMVQSEGAKRLTVLLPSQGAFFDKDTQMDDKGDLSIDFPVLQPISVSNDLQYLEAWEASKAAIVVEVQFSDLLNVLPGSEYSVGEVLVPFAEVVKNGKSAAWYTVEEDEANLVVRRASDLEDHAASSKIDPSVDDEPKIFIKVTWIPPGSTGDISIETEKEASFAIQEEMVRLALLARQQKEKLGLLGSSIGALNTVRGISSNLHMVQNTLGSVLDLCESCIHAVDFTDPFKTTMVLGGLAILWLVLSLISTRLIIITAGLAQYTITFMARFGRWLRSGKSSISSPRTSDAPTTDKDTESPVGVWLINAIRGLPTTEDLRKTYFWESRRVGALEVESLAAQKRKSRMQRLWKVQWFGTVRILKHDGVTEAFEWRAAFAMIQGHRLLWWRSVADFDEGSTPLGRLFLAGHAGLSSPSPLELREIFPEDLECVVSIFGSGERVTLRAQSVEARKELERVVDSVSSKQD